MVTGVRIAHIGTSKREHTLLTISQWAGALIGRRACAFWFVRRAAGELCPSTMSSKCDFDLDHHPVKCSNCKRQLGQAARYKDEAPKVEAKAPAAPAVAVAPAAAAAPAAPAAAPAAPAAAKPTGAAPSYAGRLP